MGIAMSTFKDKDIQTLEKWGNEKAYEYWMANHSKKRDPIPTPKEKE